MGLNLKSFSVEAGFFQDQEHPFSGTSKKYADRYGLKETAIQSLADIARWTNRGFFNSQSNTYVEPRPFFSNATEKIENQIKRLVLNALRSENPKENLGEAMKKIIQDEISSGVYVSNGEVTQELKGRDTPLDDSGYMREHVEVR